MYDKLVFTAMHNPTTIILHWKLYLVMELVLSHNFTIFNYDIIIDIAMLLF